MLYSLSDEPEEQNCYALSVESDKAVYYSSDETDATLRLLFLHEIHHLPSMVPGECHRLYKIYGTDDGVLYADREEDAATYYGRVYNEALGTYLKLPKPPRK